VAFLNAAAKARIALVLVLGVIIAGAAQGQTADEYQVKAAYMYNLAKFVDWPSDAFESPSQPIVFCVLGQTPLSRPLEDALAGKVVGQRPLVFRQLTDSTHAGACKVLFIDLPDKIRLRQTLDQVKSLHVLTVGEAADFTEGGGIVRFFLDAGRVRLEFNLDAADDARLRVSSKLLSLGKIVRRAGK
jgi:hypothetical protein